MICNEQFEQSVLACLLRNTEFCAIATQHLKPEYFSGAIQNNIAKMSLDFYSKYQTPLSVMGFVDRLVHMVKKKIIMEEEVEIYKNKFVALNKIDVHDHAYILDKLILFIKNRAIRNFIQNAVEKYLPDDNFDKLESEMQKVLGISNVQDVEEYDYLDKIEDRYNKREEEKGLKVLGIPTGIPILDKKMNYQGWEANNLYLILGGAKAGKSMALCYFANHAMLQGHNVVYFSCEVDAGVISSRIDAMNSDVAINNIPDYNAKVKDSVSSLDTKGNLFIYDYPPRVLTSRMVQEKVSKLSTKIGKPIDFIVTDYVEIMKSNRRYDDKWQEETAMAEDLRAVSKTLHIPVLSACQLQKGVANQIFIDGNSVGGAWGKIQTADFVCTIAVTKKGEVILRISESRNFEPCAFKMQTKYGFGRFYDKFVDELFD